VRLGIAHEIAIALSATLACLVALLGPGVSPFAWLALGAPWVSAFLRPRGRAAPATSGTVIGLASLALAVATLIQRGAAAAVLAATYALLGLLVARVITRRTLAHDAQLLLLSLLLVVAGSVLNLSLSYGVIFFLYGIVVVQALITRELLRGAERSSGGDEERLAALRARRDVITPGFLAGTSSVAAALLLTTALLFALFPRIGFASLGGLLTPADGRLPPSVSLRGAPRASAGGRDVIARVRGVPWEAFERGLYLRGPVYDQVSEQGFARTDVRAFVRDYRALAPAEAPVDTSYRVYLNPGAGDLLFTLGGLLGVRSVSGGRANPSHRLAVHAMSGTGELRAVGRLQTAFTYDVNGAVGAPGFVPEERDGPRALADESENLAEAYLALPEDVDPRLRALAEQVTAGATRREDKVARLRDFLLGSFEYTLAQPNGDKPRPLTSFLLEDRRGHCEYFATSQALLLRLLGIPSRVVGGYQGGAWDASDDVIVFMSKNAHAWVEWYLPGVGWVIEDPTPVPSGPRERLRGWYGLVERISRFWDDSVVDLALTDQIELVERARDALTPSPGDERVRWRPAVAIAASVVLALVLFGVARRLRRRRGARRDKTSDALLSALTSALERARGEALDEADTLREAARAAPLPREEQAALQRALALYERRRFGGEDVDETVARAAAQDLERVARGDGGSGSADPDPVHR
jgi:transglutaminase-like putative cysteine protease